VNNNKPTTPPKLAQRFLNFFLKEELVEEVLGDLYEKYLAKAEKENTQNANWNYWFQVINYLRPFAIRNDLLTQLNPFFMFRSYFKIAWRNLFKQKLYSIINVSGMTVGMTCFILLALFIQYESSYDQQHEKADRVYRVAQEHEGYTFRGTNKYAVTCVPLVPAMREQFPEVEAATMFTTLQALFWKEGQAYYENGLYADSAFFDVFDYTVLEGNMEEALQDKDAVILTETFAKKYFGDVSPLGQLMEQRDDRRVTVKAVIEDVPKNQHLDFDFITSIENYREYRRDKRRVKWANNNYWSYVVLREGTDLQEVETKMEPFGKLASAELAEYKLDIGVKYYLQALTDIHLHSNANEEIGSNGDIRYLYIAGSIAFIILLLALINYMNLATARSALRSKEVGVRKVMGARRKQLVAQFLLESMLVTGISLVLAVLLANLLLPSFNNMLDFDIPFILGANQMILVGLLGFAILLGISTGLYPALVSSTITPVKALKGGWFTNRKGKKSIFRNSLVVLQFASAIVFAISSLIVFQQLNYMQQKKLGYNRDQVVFTTYRNQKIYDQHPAIRNELMKHPNIENVCFANTLPLNSTNLGLIQNWEGHQEGEQLSVYRFRTDYDFLDLFEIELIEGRNFSPEFPADSSESYILNETAVKALGWDSPIGKSFEDGKVIGVVKDFHFQPFKFEIEPMFITFSNAEYDSYFGIINMKVKSDDMASTTEYLKTTMKKMLPAVEFNLAYMDDSYNNLYRAEQQFGKAFNLFTLLALFIACIGLFGLVTHSVLQRTKEIGVRKVLGASVANIVQLISKDFLKLVVIATFIAIPLAWYGMSNWLEGFVYRTNMPWWVFAGVGLLAIVLAFLTVSVQSLKAAYANPVDSIKSE